MCSASCVQRSACSACMLSRRRRRETRRLVLPPLVPSTVLLPGPNGSARISAAECDSPRAREDAAVTHIVPDSAAAVVGSIFAMGVCMGLFDSLRRVRKNKRYQNFVSATSLLSNAT